MILDNPDYRDTFDSMQSRAGGFDVENNSFVSSGWYSEGSVQSILYDLFDDDDGADSASYGLAPIYGAFIDPCLLYTSPSPRDKRQSRMPSSA